MTSVCPAPGLHRHYPASSPLRAGPPQCLAVLSRSRLGAARGSPSRGQGANITHFDWPTVPRRLVLLFHASACDELTPPLHRAPPGQHTGRHLAEGTPPRRAFVPGVMRAPGFGANVRHFDASPVVHSRSSSRRAPDPLTAGLFPHRSRPRLLTGAPCGGLGSPPARRARRANLHHQHSTVHVGDLLHHHHSPFRFTPHSCRSAPIRNVSIPRLAQHLPRSSSPAVPSVLPATGEARGVVPDGPTVRVTGSGRERLQRP